MRIKKTVTIGTVGAGYPAYLHGNGLEKVGGVDVRLKTICDTNLELAQKVMDRYGYEQMTASFDELLADPEIDVIDIITPPFLHVPMSIKAMRAGKHVICEKPLTGYFGKPGEENVGATPKSIMYEEILKSMDELKAVIEETGMKFMYAENFCYATPIQNTARFLRAKKSKVLFQHGFVGLKGSSSPVAGVWNKAGFDDQGYDSSDEGMLFGSGISSPATWYPAAGYRGRLGGDLRSVGSYGYYMSVALDGCYVYSLEFYYTGKVHPTDSGYRATGKSVRCLQE